MPKQLPFEDVDFAGMARNINDPGKLAPLPKERSTIAHDVMDLAKTGIETYGAIKKGQIDAKRQAEINTINAMTSACKIAGLGMKVGYGMYGDALKPAQVDEANRAGEAQRLAKPQKPLAPHYGPVYGRGGKYYQSIFQAGKEGSPALQEVELGGEPMQVTAQKQAAMARYADDVRAEASTTYDAIKTKAGLAYAAQGENVARALAAYNAVMTTEIGKLKKHQISQAVKDIWRADETPAQGSGGQPTGSGDAFPVRPVYQWTDKELLEGKQDH